MTPELKRRAAQFKRRHLPLDRTIVLVGHMGSGKSTLGRRLAQFTSLPFCDSDAEIERSAGQSIPDIFEQHGEAYFREGERRVIRRLITEEKPMVLATGGGAFVDLETQALVKSDAISIWLRPGLKTLVARTSGKGNRPLLKNKDPRKVFKALFKARDPHYSQADLKLDIGDEPPDVWALRLIKSLDRYLKTQDVNAQDVKTQGQKTQDQKAQDQRARATKSAQGETL